jgi:hypothetical protein
MKNKRNRRPVYANQHATIKSLPNFDAQIGGTTFTSGREDEFDVAIATDSSNVSRLDLVIGQTGVSLSGRQARTLQRALNKHYENCGTPAILGIDTF